MATVANYLNITLLATSPRFISVEMPGNINMDFDSVTGTTKPDDNATLNQSDTITIDAINTASGTAVWSGVFDDGNAPANNATVGAAFDTNISGTINSSNVTTFVGGNALTDAQINDLSVNTLTTGTITSDSSYYDIYIGKDADTIHQGIYIDANTAISGGNALRIKNTIATGTHSWEMGYIEAGHTGALYLESEDQTANESVLKVNAKTTATTFSPYGVRVIGSANTAGISANMTDGVAGFFVANDNTTALIASNTDAGSLAHAFRAYSGTSSGYVGWVGATDYDFYASGSSSDYGPFTGSHDIYLDLNHSVEIGDIVIDKELVHSNGISNTIFKVESSSSINQKASVGVLSKIGNVTTSTEQPQAVFVDGYEMVPDTRKIKGNPNSNELDAQGFIIFPDKRQDIVNPRFAEIEAQYICASCNSLGEGQINVCGENGDIGAGDLITTSSIEGKGMRQDDDLIHNYTVAKSRGDVTFTHVGQVKLVPCIYLCG